MLKITFGKKNCNGTFCSGIKMENEREGSQVCEECGESVPLKQVNIHNLRKHDKREFQCETCGITTVGYEKHRTHKVCELNMSQEVFEQVFYVDLALLKLSSSGPGSGFIIQLNCHP